MERARKLILQSLDKTDVVVEVGDARAPTSSRNPLLAELIGEKPRFWVLNKVDFADRARLEDWLRRREGAKDVPMLISCRREQGIEELRTRIRDRCRAFKWYPVRDARVLVVGLPNVGKSALINALAERRKTSVANKPGHTRGVQLVSAGRGLLIWDTPGILWPKFEDPATGIRLALTGAIKNDLLDPVELLSETYPELVRHHGAALSSRYKLSNLPEDPVTLLQTLARTRVPLLPGGVPDLQAAGALVLKEFQDGLLGPAFLD